VYGSSSLFIRSALALRYKTAVNYEPGAKEAILDPARGTLLVMNHPTWGVEAGKVFAEISRLGIKPLIVIDENQLTGLTGMLASPFELISIPDMTKKNGDANALQSASARISAALAEKKLVVIAGSGRIYRSRTESMGSMVGQLLSTRPDTHVVTAYSDGLWGSRFSMAGTGEYPKIGSVLMKGALSTAANLGMNPKHPWTLTFTNQTAALANQTPAQINDTLNAVFNTTENGVNHPRMGVRHRLGWWQNTVPVPDPAIAQVAGDIHSVPDEVRQAVVDKLIEITGAEELSSLGLDNPALLTKQLRNHLGMDSLTTAELLLWVEEYTAARTGTKFQSDSTDSVLTVQDLMLAANGAGEVKGGSHIALPSKRWLEPPKNKRLRYTWRDDTFTHKWLEKVIADPNGVTIADPKFGAPTNRRLFQMVLGLLPKIEAIPGDRIGILLPSGVPAFVAVQAIRLAGKTPVFLNFTTGLDSVRTALRITGVEHVFTAGAVLSKIKWGDTEAKTLGVDFVEFEKVVSEIGLGTKLGVAWQSYTGAAKSLLQRRLSLEAGILVTSGSTGTPKSIAFTDEMLGYFVEGLLSLVHVNEGDRLIQTGPPFHILGYIAGIVMPSLLDLKVGLIPNPTDYKELASMTELYALNRAVSPPAFAEGMAVASLPGQMDALQLLVYGAQAMSQGQRATISAQAPQLMIHEAYGSTETTGGLAVQHENSEGWMELLPTVRYKLLDVETGAQLGLGSQGELCVRGPTIIKSYVQSADPELSSESEAFAEIDGQKYFKTGDLIQVHPTNPRWIRFVTRVARTYKDKAGEFINPDLIENALGVAFPRVETDAKGPLFSVTGAKQEDGFKRTVMFSTRPMTVQDANQAILGQGLQAVLRVQRVYVVDAIPLAGSGKVALATINRWAAELENADASTYSEDLRAALVP
ncbi:AMP-binding protein, partial [bacterium]|nr:AMP-binding protein [bacterium]